MTEQPVCFVGYSASDFVGSATMLGHSRVAITLDIYSHVSLELEKKAAAKLNAAFMGKR